MVESLNGVIDGAEIRRERMLQNLSGGLGLHAASRLLTALVDAGANRATAYSLVQAAATQARESGKHLRETCQSTPEITSLLSAMAVDELFDDKKAIANASILVERLSELK
jgi:adenylosuccinate lyase